MSRPEERMSLDQVDFVCISLDFRADRRAQIKTMFEQLGILDRMNWWTVGKHPKGGIYGCFESHYSIWQSSEFRRPYLWVFEDDIGLSALQSNVKDRFHLLLEYVQTTSSKDFELINLEPGPGFKNRSIHSEYKLGTIHQGFFFHTGCYIVRRESLPRISKNIRSWYGMDIDTSLYQNCRMAGLLPPMFEQVDQESNNDGGWRDIFSRFSSKQTTTNHYKESNSWLGWLSIEMAQLGSWYLIFGKNQPELIDRRVDLD